MSVYKKILYKLVIICLILQSFPLSAVNKLFDESIVVTSDDHNRKNRAIYFFRDAHRLDEIAVKVLAKNGAPKEAEKLLVIAKSLYLAALKLHPNNTLINIFYEAHDSMLGETIVPGDPRAKTALVHLYDGDDDTRSDFDISLDDPDMCSFWQASKLNAAEAAKAVMQDDENDKPDKNRNNKFAAVTSTAVFVGGLSLAIVKQYTEDLLYQYIAGGSGAAFVVLTYLVGYIIARCCAKHHKDSKYVDNYNDFVGALAAGIPNGDDDDDDDDARAPVRLSLGPISASGHGVVASAEVPQRTTRRRLSDDHEEEVMTHDVLDTLPAKYRELYLKDLKDNGTEGKIVKKVHELNRKLKQKQEESNPQQKTSFLVPQHIAENSQNTDDDDDFSHDDIDEIDGSNDSDNDVPLRRVKKNKKKAKRAKKRAATETVYPTTTTTTTTGAGNNSNNFPVGESVQHAYSPDGDESV